MAIGLGDWCPVGKIEDQYNSPLIFTDSVLTMDIAEKAAYIFETLGMPLQSQFAAELARRTKAAVRKYLVDFDRMLALGNCQTSQAMALYYHIFEEGNGRRPLKTWWKSSRATTITSISAYWAQE